MSFLLLFAGCSFSISSGFLLSCVVCSGAVVECWYPSSLFLLFAGGFWWQFLLFCFSFASTLILAICSSSFSKSLLSSASYVLKVLSPSLHVSLGIAHRLYSLLLLSRLCFLLSWMMTDSQICLVIEDFADLIILIPNLMFSSSSVGWCSTVCFSIWLFVLRFVKSARCSQPRSYTLRELSPTYLWSLILSFCFLALSLSPPASSSTFFMSFSSQFIHQVSYTIFRLVQSCEVSFPVLCFVRQSKQLGLEQSWPCQGSAFTSTFSSFVPARSTILSLYPVISWSDASASLIFLASLLPLV